MIPAILSNRVVFFIVCFWLFMWPAVPAHAENDGSEGLLSGQLRYHSAPMLLVDPDSGGILDANEAAARFYGYSIDRLIHMNIDEINVLNPKELATERQKSVREERNYFIFPHRLADGTLRTVEVYSSPINYGAGGKKVLLSVILDMSGKKSFESEFNAYKTRLEEMFSQRTNQLVANHTNVQESLQVTILFQAVIILLLLVTLLYRRQIQKTLLRQKQMVDSMLDSSLQFMGLLDMEGRLLQANHTALERFEVGLDAVRNRFFWETPWWSHSLEEQTRLRRAVLLAAMGEESRFETRHPLPGGEFVYVDFSIRPVFDVHGKPVSLLVEGRDVTSRKQAEEQLLARRRELQDANSYLKTLIEALPDTLMELDESGRIYQFHSMHPDFPAPAPDGPGGWSIQDSLTNEVSEVILSALQKAKEQSGLRGVTFRNSPTRQFELSVTPLPETEGLAPRFVVLLREVTERGLPL